LPLIIDKTELINEIGHIDLDIAKIQALLKNRNADVTEVRNSIQNCIKMLNTIANREGLTPTTSRHTVTQLRSMRIVP